MDDFFQEAPQQTAANGAGEFSNGGDFGDFGGAFSVARPSLIHPSNFGGGTQVTVFVFPKHLVACVGIFSSLHTCEVCLDVNFLVRVCHLTLKRTAMTRNEMRVVVRRVEQI